MSHESITELWNAFRHSSGHTGQKYDVWHFADNPKDADELVELVIAGVKRATAPALWSFEYDGEPLPAVGDFSVVTDWAGQAKCVIQTTDVEIVQFSNVSAAFAEIEGEGDKSLRYWRSVHQPYYEREMQRIGRELRDDLPVVCQRFDCVFPRSP